MSRHPAFVLNFAWRGLYISNILIVTNLMALDPEATGFNFWEWDLLWTIT